MPHDIFSDPFGDPFGRPFGGFGPLGDIFFPPSITVNIIDLAPVVAGLVAVGDFLGGLIHEGQNLTAEGLGRIETIVREILDVGIGELGSLLEQHDGDVLGALADQSDAFAQVVNGSETRIKDIILAGVDVAQRASERSTAEIIGSLGGSIDRQTEVLNATQAKSTGSILDGINTNTGVLGSLSEIVLGGLSTVGGDIGDIIDVLRDGLNTTIQNRIVIDSSIFGDVLDTVGEIVKQSQAENAGVLTTLTNVVTGVIGELVGTVGDELGELHPELRKVWQSITTQGEQANEIAEKVLDPSADGTGGRVTRSVIEQIEPGMERSAEALQRSFVDFVERTGAECLTEQERRELTELPSGVDGIAGSIFLWIAHMASAIFKLLGLAQAEAQKTIFQWQECNPNQPLPPAETVLALQRGFIDAGEAQANLQKQGWTADDAERLVNVGFTAPDLSLAYAAWLRGEIDDDALEHLFDTLGYTKSFHPVLKKLAFFIPPVQDLITMAVREVFTPEIAEAQGQFEDFPADFAKFARQQGVSEEWAQNYWAAHWSLPSVQMGFEMLHRDVISQEQLNTLLRALDIMPGWRGPLTKISFAPFTRRDIRRMNRLGVLDESEVLRAFKDIGYDDDKAQKQLQFVLEANQEDDLLTLDVASDLTRSSILSFYSDGIIPRAAARLLLLQAGINVAAAELFLLGADFDIERRDRKGAVDLILDRFRFGGASLTESADEINALAFETRERDLALLDLERLNQQETKLPTKADLDKFLKAGIIDANSYVDMLERQGFPVLWADRYLQLEQGE